jgi:hypothetical protein
MQWVPRALSPGVKWKEREAGHSRQTSVVVKKTWVYTSTTPYAFMAQCLVGKAQGQFYLYVKLGVLKRIDDAQFPCNVLLYVKLICVKVKIKLSLCLTN